MPSYRTEIIPRLTARPPVIKHDGWYEFVVVHDLWYLQEKRRWRAWLRRQHPDLTGFVSDFKETLARYQTWLRNERVYYAMRRLRPPDESVLDGIEPLRLVRTVTGRWQQPGAYECGTVYRYWHGCRCPDCCTAANTYRAPWARPSQKQFECGMVNRYWQGCRCPLCKQAGQAWHRDFRLKHPRPRKARPLKQFACGTVSRYVQGCRCPLCRRANRDRDRFYRMKRRGVSAPPEPGQTGTAKG